MITVLDYGVGNLQAYKNMLAQVGISYNVASASADVERATHLILPGVGAFDYVMKTLTSSGLLSTLNQYALVERRPILGVCVGMQIMFEGSEEGALNGLGWFPGEVHHLSKILPGTHPRLPVPHMGWNSLEWTANPPLNVDSRAMSEFYFLHSYYCQPRGEELVSATSDYGDRFCSVAALDNIIGIQCHPEKSHSNGANFLKAFSEL